MGIETQEGCGSSCILSRRGVLVRFARLFTFLLFLLLSLGQKPALYLLKRRCRPRKEYYQIDHDVQLIETDRSYVQSNFYVALHRQSLQRRLQSFSFGGGWSMYLLLSLSQSGDVIKSTSISLLETKKRYACNRDGP